MQGGVCRCLCRLKSRGAIPSLLIACKTREVSIHHGFFHAASWTLAWKHARRKPLGMRAPAHLALALATTLFPVWWAILRNGIQQLMIVCAQGLRGMSAGQQLALGSAHGRFADSQMPGTSANRWQHETPAQIVQQHPKSLKSHLSLCFCIQCMPWRSQQLPSPGKLVHAHCFNESTPSLAAMPHHT